MAYIRSIHTSFTAAHSASNPCWARSHAAAPLLPTYPPAPSAPPARPRAYAFRAPPHARPKPAYKFDPFADEPTAPVPTHAPRRAHYTPPPHRRPGAAFDGEIWRGFSPLPRARALTYEIEEYDDSPAPAPIPPPAAPVARRTTLNPASPVFTPSRPLARTPSPPTPAPPPSYAATKASILNDKDAKARLVAGILLNRVHLPKPSQRRRPVVGDTKRQYIPSRLRHTITA